MRNILARAPQRDKDAFAAELKEIWLAQDEKEARNRAEAFMTKYENKYPKAIKCLEDGLDDSLTYYAFSRLEAKKYPPPTCWNG